MTAGLWSERTAQNKVLEPTRSRLARRDPRRHLLKINNGRAEGLNNHVRLITRRAYGFHSAKVALALIMLTGGRFSMGPAASLVP